MSISSQIVILLFSKFWLKFWWWLKRNFIWWICWFITFIVRIACIITFKGLISIVILFFSTLLQSSFIKNKLTTSILLWTSERFLRSIRILIHMFIMFILRWVLISYSILLIVWTSYWIIRSGNFVIILT